MKYAIALCAVSLSLSAQVNKAANFSFEVPGLTPGTAANWSPAWGGYQRVLVQAGQNWDGSYAARLSGPSDTLLGATQRIDLYQIAHAPVLITMRVRGEAIANAVPDNIGASFDCRVKWAGQSQLSFCPTTPRTKNTGTFGWRYIGVNTTDLVNGHLPIEWLEVRLRRGAVSGSAWFDDVQVKEFLPGSFGGAVTFMFDDAYIEHRNMAPFSLNYYGWNGVVAAVSSYVVSGDPQYCSVKDILALQNYFGWEIVSHSVSHADLVAISQQAMESELYWSKRFFTDNGVRVSSFALPFGSYNASVLGLNEERGYYGAMRNSEDGYNPMGTFPYSVKIQKMEWDTTLADVYRWLAEARSRKAWLVLMFHKIRPACSDRFCVSQSMFRETLAVVKSHNLPVVTFEQGLNLVKSPR